MKSDPQSGGSESPFLWTRGIAARETLRYLDRNRFNLILLGGGGASVSFWRNQIFGRNYRAEHFTRPHFDRMRPSTANILIRVEPELVEKMDAWRARSASIKATPRQSPI
jgi:hypothetical protein